MTKRDNFLAIREVLTNGEGTVEQVEFVDAQIALIDKRAGAERKPNKGQLANEALKAEFVEFLTNGPATATEVATQFDVTVQKASQLLRQLVKAETVTRTEGKGKVKTTFSIPAE